MSSHPAAPGCALLQVLDEVPVGMISNHNVCVLVQRSRDVLDKTLVVSPAIGLGQMLLACLLLLKLAHEREGWKAGLSRNDVPATDTKGPGAGQAGGSPHEDRDPGSGQAAEGQAEGQVPQPPPPKRRRLHAPGDQGEAGAGAGAGPEAPSVHTEHVEIDVGSSGSNGSSNSYTAPGALCASGSPAHHSHTQPQLCSFASVGLTGRVISSTRFGKILEVRLHHAYPPTTPYMGRVMLCASVHLKLACWCGC